jgi:hypothetical protein
VQAVNDARDRRGVAARNALLGVVALLAAAAFAAAARAADPPPVTNPVTVPTQTVPTPATDPAPVVKPKPRPAAKAVTPHRSHVAPARTHVTRTPTVVHHAPVTPVYHAPTYTPPAPTHTVTPVRPAPTHVTRKHAKGKHVAAKKHRRPAVAHPVAPKRAAVLGARYTTPITPVPVSATVPAPSNWALTAFWILALGLPVLLVIAALMPAAILPYELRMEWVSRRGSVAGIAVTVLLLDAMIYLFA